jgi:hypothetical protein
VASSSIVARVTERVWVSAFLAESVIEDTLGVLSAIRIVDRLQVWASLTRIDEKGKTLETIVVPPTVTCSLVILLRKVAGDAESIELRIRLRDPDGKIIGGGELALELSSSGSQAVTPVSLAVHQAGRYVFEISINKTRRASVPFDVVIEEPAAVQ